MKIKVVKSDESIILPTRGSPSAAGWDIHIPDNSDNFFMEETRNIKPGETVVFKLGFRMEIPEGHYVFIVPRSSLDKKGLHIPNSPATIDSDFRGEARLLLRNFKDRNVQVFPNQRVAQMILLKYEEVEFEEVNNLSETVRGEGGFGSTGS